MRVVILISHFIFPQSVPGYISVRAKLFMGKLVAAINMTLDGFCDHTAVNADDEMHDYYTQLLRGAGAVLYGRVTYQLMESYWPSVVINPTGNRSTHKAKNCSPIQDSL